MQYGYVVYYRTDYSDCPVANDISEFVQGVIEDFKQVYTEKV